MYVCLLNARDSLFYNKSRGKWTDLQRLKSDNVKVKNSLSFKGN